MPSWPNALPQTPLIASYAEELGFPVIHAPVDGPPLSRRRYTAAPDVISVAFVMTTAEVETFKAFYRDDIKHGSLTYTWNERGIAGATVRTYRMTGPPSIIPLSDERWRVSFGLILLPT